MLFRSQLLDSYLLVDRITIITANRLNNTAVQHYVAVSEQKINIKSNLLATNQTQTKTIQLVSYGVRKVIKRSPPQKKRKQQYAATDTGSASTLLVSNKFT